ncbi:MAG: hypothetical protein GW938_03170 [Leptospira sp.]|nr:hypothetical protein [Leptospira sp.]NCS94805.1 hypothetical protein [Leptospira sp.]
MNNKQQTILIYRYLIFLILPMYFVILGCSSQVKKEQPEDQKITVIEKENFEEKSKSQQIKK